MQCVRPADFASFKNFLGIEVGFSWGRARQGHCRVSLEHKRRVGIAVKIDGDSGDAHIFSCSDDSPCNLASVCD